MLDAKHYATYVSVPTLAIDTLARVLKTPPGAAPEYVLNKATIIVGAAVAEINEKFAAMHALIASDTTAAALWAELDGKDADATELTRLFGRALALATRHARALAAERADADAAAHIYQARITQLEQAAYDSRRAVEYRDAQLDLLRDAPPRKGGGA